MDYETVGLSELGVNGPDADDGDDHPMSPAARAASVVQGTSLNGFSLESNESRSFDACRGVVEEALHRVVRLDI
jgi:hypothetical protein